MYAALVTARCITTYFLIESAISPFQSEAALVEELFSVLGDRTRPSDADLPDTGVGIELERNFSSIHVSEVMKTLGSDEKAEAHSYGTRTSTVVLVSPENHVKYFERTIDATSKEWNSGQFDFYLEKVPDSS